eukprot:s624_g23.t1
MVYGLVDFLTGASACANGKGILAFPSRTHKGVPRIVPHLKEAAGVVTTRAQIQYVVTENGSANLFGKTLPERARLTGKTWRDTPKNASRKPSTESGSRAGARILVDGEVFNELLMPNPDLKCSMSNCVGHRQTIGETSEQMMLICGFVD